MVAETPTSLSPADLLLLAAFLNPALTLTDLADEAGLTFTELLAWASRPEIEAELDALRTLAAMRSELHASTLHSPALATLTSLLESADSPVESRRIATTVVRATAPRRPRARPQEPSRDPYPEPCRDPRPRADEPTPETPPQAVAHAKAHHHEPVTEPCDPAILPPLLPAYVASVPQPLDALDSHHVLGPRRGDGPAALLQASGRAPRRRAPP